MHYSTYTEKYNNYAVILHCSQMWWMRHWSKCILCIEKTTILQKVTNSFHTILKPAFDKKKMFYCLILFQNCTISEKHDVVLYILRYLYKILKFDSLNEFGERYLLSNWLVLSLCQPLFMNVYVYVWYNSLALLSIVQENLLQRPIWLLYGHFKQKVIQNIQFFVIIYSCHLFHYKCYFVWKTIYKILINHVAVLFCGNAIDKLR